MNNGNVYSFKNFDFLAHSFARMKAEGRSVDILAVAGNMDEEQRNWFLERFNFYYQQAQQNEPVKEPEVEY